MKKNTQKFAAILFMAFLTIGLASCSKDNSDESPLIPKTALVKIVFVDSLETSGRNKIDLSKVTTAKIEYVHSDGETGIQNVKEVDLIMSGNAKRIVSLDTKILTFNAGSKVTIHSANLYDSEGRLLGGSSNEEPDAFTVEGTIQNSIMERIYTPVFIER